MLALHYQTVTEWPCLHWHINTSDISKVLLLCIDILTPPIKHVKPCQTICKNSQCLLQWNPAAGNIEIYISSWLLSHISSVIIFSLHINVYNCYIQCALTCCYLNGNINVNVREILNSSSSHGNTDTAISQLYSSTMWVPTLYLPSDFNKLNLNTLTNNKNELGKKFSFI
jgi:hypothetical protein